MRLAPLLEDIVCHLLFGYNGDVVGPDGPPAELFKIALTGDSVFRQTIVDIAVGT